MVSSKTAVGWPSFDLIIVCSIPSIQPVLRLSLDRRSLVFCCPIIDWGCRRSRSASCFPAIEPDFPKLLALSLSAVGRPNIEPDYRRLPRHWIQIWIPFSLIGQCSPLSIPHLIMLQIYLFTWFSVWFYRVTGCFLNAFSGSKIASLGSLEWI